MDMTKGKIVPIIVRFSLPLLAGNLLQLLYSTTDSFIVGNYCGELPLAAIGASANIIFTVTGFFGGLANGAGVVVSHAFGAGDGTKVRTIVRSVLLALSVLGVGLSFLGMFISPYMLRMIAVPDEVFVEADVYLRIYFSGMCFILFYNICAGILRALGNSRSSFYVLALTVALNVVLDFIFILFLHRGLSGAAYATVIAEAVAAFFSAVVVLRQLRKIPCAASSAGGVGGRFSVRSLGTVLKLGLPGALSSGVLNFSNTFMQRYINVFGADCMAGWAVYTRFDQLAILPMASIAMTAMTFSGQNYGAGEISRVRKGIRSALLLGLLVVTFMSSALIIFAPQLVAIFNSGQDVVRYGALFIRASTSFYVFCFGTMLFCQVSQGLGFPIVPTFITFMGFVVLRQSYLFIVTRFSDALLPVAFAYPLSWPPTLLFEFLYLRSKMRKIRHAAA